MRDDASADEQPQTTPRAGAPPAAGGPPGAGPGRRLTPVEIQQKEFRLAFRGYNERDVDQFLDEITEEMARLHAENKRLREEAEMRGTTRLDTGAVMQAEEILRRAREQAARIVADAESRAQTAQPDPGAAYDAPAAPSPPIAASPEFLARERDFLQTLASLIQGHANAVREDLRRAREAAGASTAAPESEAAPAEGDPAVVDERPAAGATGASAANAEPGPPTQAWTPPFADEERSGPSASSAGGSASPSDRTAGARPSPSATRIATQPAGVATVTEERPEPAPTTDIGSPPVNGSSSRPPALGTADGVSNGLVGSSADDDGEDRSLRELFWGED